jgi:hypothetical protein
MPDITMCEGKGCELRSTCYRYTAEPSKYRQSYFIEPPIKDGECDEYWEDPKQVFIAGAKWPQEQNKNKYSEEDMRKAFKSSSLTNILDVYESFEEFIEQFKNK